MRQVSYLDLPYNWCHWGVMRQLVGPWSVRTLASLVRNASARSCTWIIGFPTSEEMGHPSLHEACRCGRSRTSTCPTNGDTGVSCGNLLTRVVSGRCHLSYAMRPRDLVRGSSSPPPLKRWATRQNLKQWGDHAKAMGHPSRSRRGREGSAIPSRIRDRGVPGAVSPSAFGWFRAAQLDRWVWWHSHHIQP